MATTRWLTLILLLIAATGCQAGPPSTPVVATPGAVPAATATPGADPAATGTPAPAVQPVEPTATPTQPPPAETAFATPTDSSGKGRLRLATTLGSNGEPLAAAPVSVRIAALDDTVQVIKLKGIVPVPAQGTLVGFRFNEEGAGPAPIDMNVYRITYADGGSAKNRVVNSDFASGLYSWDAWGNGAVTVRHSDRGDGRMLRIRADADENIGINSFGVRRFRPGSNFVLTVTARVPPAGSASGYAAVFFLWKPAEGHRLTVPLVAPSIPSVELLTDAGGAIALDVGLPAGRYAVRIHYPGDAGHRPSRIDLEVTVD